MRKTILRNYLYDNALQKTTFLCCKSMVFGVQKPYFYIAKRGCVKTKNSEKLPFILTVSLPHKY